MSLLASSARTHRHLQDWACRRVRSWASRAKGAGTAPWCWAGLAGGSSGPGRGKMRPTRGRCGIVPGQREGGLSEQRQRRSPPCSSEAEVRLGQRRCIGRDLGGGRGAWRIQSRTWAADLAMQSTARRCSSFSGAGTRRMQASEQRSLARGFDGRPAMLGTEEGGPMGPEGIGRRGGRVRSREIAGVPFPAGSKRRRAGGHGDPWRGC